MQLVPKWLQIAYEKYGGIQIAIPRNILLNIPRTGYSQEQRFLHRLQVAVLHAMMKAILKDHIEGRGKVPGETPDYFSNESVIDNRQAKRIAALM